MRIFFVILNNAFGSIATEQGVTRSKAWIPFNGNTLNTIVYQTDTFDTHPFLANVRIRDKLPIDQTKPNRKSDRFPWQFCVELVLFLCWTSPTLTVIAHNNPNGKQNATQHKDVTWKWFRRTTEIPTHCSANSKNKTEQNQTNKKKKNKVPARRNDTERRDAPNEWTNLITTYLYTSTTFATSTYSLRHRAPFYLERAYVSSISRCSYITQDRIGHVRRCGVCVCTQRQQQQQRNWEKIGWFSLHRSIGLLWKRKAAKSTTTTTNKYKQQRNDRKYSSSSSRGGREKKIARNRWGSCVQCLYIFLVYCAACLVCLLQRLQTQTIFTRSEYYCTGTNNRKFICVFVCSCMWVRTQTSRFIFHLNSIFDQ